MQELQKLYNDLVHKNTKKVDVLAPLASIRFIAEDNKNYMIIQDGEVLPSEFNDYNSGNIEGRKIHLTQHALQQICSKVGIPMSYIMKCDPELRQHNMNHWMQKSTDNNLIRCILDNGSSRVRAVLSDKYTPVDDSFVVSSLNNAIENSNLDAPAVTKIYSGDDMLRLQITDGKKPVIGDTTLGFFIGNSESGLSKIYVEMGLYTYTCTNGLRIPKFAFDYNRKHIGNISYNLIQENFHSQISGIMSNYSRMIAYMGIANQITVKRSVFSKYIEDSKNFTIDFKDSMKTRIKSLPGDNVLWDYISQMTHQAQAYPEFQRMEIEKQAGVYMDDIIQKETKRGKYELAIA